MNGDDPIADQHTALHTRAGDKALTVGGVLLPTCVYDVCMARLNVYVPDDLAEAARAAELNVSAITQAAIRSALEADSVRAWLDSLSSLEAVDVTHAEAERALTEARDELWGDG